jgi:hypothetical protein
MEITQGNSLCYFKQAKTSFFNLFFFVLLQNQRTEVWSRSCPGEVVDTSGKVGGRWQGKWVGGKYGANTVYM